MIYHGDTESRSKLLHEVLTERVIGAAVEVHRERALPVEYKNIKLDCGYRLDLVVEDKVILELSAWSTFCLFMKLNF